MNEDHREHGAARCFWRSRYGVGLLLAAAAAAIAAYVLLNGHGAHAVEALPYLLLAACPLMHLFMHGAHAGHGDRAQAPKRGHDEDRAPPTHTHGGDAR